MQEAANHPDNARHVRRSYLITGLFDLQQFQVEY